MMSQQSRKEYVREVRVRYLNAAKKEKTKLLDDLAAFTRYNRKYALRLVSPAISLGEKKRKTREKKYGPDVIVPLIRI